MNQKHAIGIHGFVLVYSVISRNSFEMVNIIYDKIVNFTGNQDIPVVIVGSKLDLLSTTQRCVSHFAWLYSSLWSAASHHHFLLPRPHLHATAHSPNLYRQVPEEEVEEFAKSINASWIETSAKENLNVGKRLTYCELPQNVIFNMSGI